MNSSLAEVLDAARALPRSERAEVAQEMIATLETTSDYDDARYAELKEAVSLGLDQIDRGEIIDVPVDELRAYVRSLGCEATEGLTRKSA